MKWALSQSEEKGEEEEVWWDNTSGITALTSCLGKWSNVIFLLNWSETWSRSDSAVVSGRSPPSPTEPEFWKAVSDAPHQIMMLWSEVGHVWNSKEKKITLFCHMWCTGPSEIKAADSEGFGSHHYLMSWWHQTGSCMTGMGCGKRRGREPLEGETG